MAHISFSCAAPVASWSPSVNPAFGRYAQTEEHFQPQDFAGADLYSYDHGHSHGRVLEWTALPAVDMVSLLAFMMAMHGGVHAFTFTDYDAATYTARILNSGKFPYRQTVAGFYEATLILEVQ
jgi:hypothetical protein